MPELSNTGDRNSLASNGAGNNPRVWASKAPMCFTGRGGGSMSSLKAKKVGGVDKKIETILGDRLSQLVPNGDLWNGKRSKCKPGESWGCGGLILPLGLTSKKGRGLLRGEGGVFRALSEALESRDPNFFRLLLPGHTTGS